MSGASSQNKDASAEARQQQASETVSAARTPASSSSPSEERAEQTSPAGLTPEEERIVAELRQVDREVRAHENAHLAAAGGLARGVSFTYVTGPDGQQYAVAGEVSIDTSPVAGDPEATIQKAQQIRAAASAPANPSSQDRAVAAQASQMEAAARAELAAQQREKIKQQLEEGSGSRLEQPSAGGTNLGSGTLFSAVA